MGFNEQVGFTNVFPVLFTSFSSNVEGFCSGKGLRQIDDMNGKVAKGIFCVVRRVNKKKL